MLGPLADILPHVVWETDPRGQLTAVNARWVEYTGVCADDSMRLGWSAVLHPDDVGARLGTRPDGFGDTQMSRVRVRRRDGAWRWHELRACAVRESDGTLSRWVGTLTDVHDEQSSGETTLTDRPDRTGAIPRTPPNHERAILDALLGQAPIGIAILDRELRYLEVNEVLARMNGRARDAHLGRHLDEIIDAESAARAKEIAAEVLASGLPSPQLHVRWRVGVGDGAAPKVNDGLASYVPVRSGESIVGIAVIIVDVTDERRMAEALAESERRFRMVQDASHEGFLALRAERAEGAGGITLRCVYANHAASETLGSERTIAGADLREVWPEIEQSILWGLLTRVLDGGEAQSVEVARPTRGAGSWFQCWVAPLGPDEVALRFDDITARKRGEQALAIVGEVTRALGASLVREEMLQGFARSVVVEMADVCAVHLRDATGRVRCVATADSRTDSPDTRAIADLFRDDESAKHGLGAVLRTGTSDLVAEVTPDLLRSVARDDDARRALEGLGTRAWIFVPLSVRGEVAGALTLESAQAGRPYDLADRFIAEELGRRVSAALENVLLYEEAQRANALKDEFLSIVSHELRTPLSTILGWSKLLMDDPKPAQERVRKGLEVIQRNAQAQARIVDDILDTSRILRNKITLDPKVVPVSAPMEEAVDLVRNGATERGIEMALDVDRAATVRGDAMRLRQIFFHLLTNAVKFTPQGGRVTARVVRDGNATIAQVIDTGAGIDPSFLPFLFDRFRQADASSTRRHGGLGLGLAISRKLVELHGGTISVQSEGLGRGATFTVRLPDGRASSEPGTSPGISIAPRAKTPDLVGVRVLLVDDHDDARELYGSVLSLRGARVTLAASAAQARARLAESRFDILVSDIAMPYEDGISLVSFAKKHDPVMQAIAISAFSQPDDVRRALEAGFEHYLTKPVDTHELVTKVAELCDVRTSSYG
ncbi:ATP-binding protein [Sandaracinus amylolyticus]|uniref:histidine kinase n=1 Tax=Sandaracinus amylolyticus TaxID=927083 RepID=A0A0F6W9F6_9BACT|nr:ATP-binding protein [Sandaracinus amylolyticus]AKF10740.1 Two-component hybrid sensor and regulator [Sandaracinus amylolyticus]